jgi:DNA polymerase III subunit delta'
MTIIRGHDAQIAAFLTAMRGERPPHGWLLAGQQGIGKASLARQFARRLLAEAADPTLTDADLMLPDSHPTARLADAHSHPDLLIIDRLPKDMKAVRDLDPREWPDTLERARSISIDQVRGMAAACTMKPSLSSRRIVIFDAVDDLERGGANALLKTLEEPPAGTIFLLVSHAPGRLLPTIRSRCRLLRFQPLADDVMASVLGPGTAEQAAIIADAQGSPGRAKALMGLKLDALRDAVARIAATGDPNNIIRVDLATSLSSKAAHARFEAFLTLAPRFLADHARTQSGVALEQSLKAWEEVRDLAGHAIPGSLDPFATTMALAGIVATLAPEGASAKA